MVAPMRDIVRNAAKLAVYEEMMMSAKKNHKLRAIRVEAALELRRARKETDRKVLLSDWRGTHFQKKKNLLWQNITSLLHNTAHGEPNAIGHCPNILQLLWILFARMGIVPIVSCHSGSVEN